MEKQIDERFRKHERLRKREEIKLVLLERGDKGVFCIIHTCKNSLCVSRLGVVVTRTVGGSVERNRVKRQFREVFRRIKNRLITTVDLVIRAKRSINQASYQAILDDICNLLIKQNLLKEDSSDRPRRKNSDN